MLSRHFGFFAGAFCALSSLVASEGRAQNTYRIVQETVYDNVPVTKTRRIEETVMEKKEVTEWEERWVTETSERRTQALQPVITEKYIESRQTTYKPVIETSMREELVPQTRYEEVTEYQDRQVYVEKPVTETVYRDETVTVQKPITETYYKVDNVTNYVAQPQLQTVCRPTLVQQEDRTRLRWLSGGYYMDPNTNAQVYRRPGLHWVQPNATLSTQMVPEQQLTTVMVPQTTQQLKPVTVTSMQDVTETRRVPITRETTQTVVETQRVPVVVRKPVTEYVRRSVPVETKVYKPVEEIVKVPYQEKTYKVVDVVEPETRQVLKRIPVTRIVEVPKTVIRTEEYQAMESVPRIETRKIPTDEFGRLLPELPPIYVREKAADDNLSSPSATSDSEAADQSPSISTEKPAVEDGNSKGVDGEFVDPATAEDKAEDGTEKPNEAGAGQDAKGSESGDKSVLLRPVSPDTRLSALRPQAREASTADPGSIHLDAPVTPADR